MASKRPAFLYLGKYVSIAAFHCPIVVCTLLPSCLSHKTHVAHCLSLACTRLLSCLAYKTHVVHRFSLAFTRLLSCLAYKTHVVRATILPQPSKNKRGHYNTITG